MKPSPGEEKREKLKIYLHILANGVKEEELRNFLSRMLKILGETGNPEFQDIEGQVEMSTEEPDDSTCLAVGFADSLKDKAKGLSRPLPAIVLSREQVISDFEQEVLLCPLLSIETVVRWDRVAGNSPDPEETSLLLNSLKRRTRKTLRNNRAEETFAKRITWKIDMKNEQADPGFMSFFGDSSTKEMAEDLKSAILSVKTRWSKSLETLKGLKLPAPDPSDLQSLAKELGKMPEGKNSRPPSILLLGETGTGKTMLARYITQFLTDGKDSLRQLNIGAISHDFMYGELFGGTRGAWTGLEEDWPGFLLSNLGKPVFLDEIGDMEGRCQVQLLTLLDKGEVKPLKWKTAPLPCPIVIIAASNRPLRAWAEEESERFRNDLFHRFDHVIEVPPLRERKADLRLLISTTLQDPEVNPRLEKQPFLIERISLDAIQHLEGLDYPGNFRELRYRLSRAVAEATREGSTTICLRHLVKIG